MPTKKRSLVSIACLLVLVTVTSARPQTPGGCYPELPPALSNEVDKVVNSVLQNDARAVLSLMPRLVSFTVADVVAHNEILKLDVYQYYGDVLRTDQQVGASSTSSGSTSAIEKPGLLQLLGFAIERGAIQQSISDSTVTLSTSPYAFVAAVKGDSPETYRDNELLTRLGVSATFVIGDPNNVLGNVSRKQLTEWSAKLRLTGDRSTRSEAFQELWNKKLGVYEQKRLDILGALESKIFNVPTIVDRFKTNGDLDVVTPLQKKIADYLTANNITATPDVTTVAQVHRTAIRGMVLCTLFTEVHEPVRNGTIIVDEAAVASSLNQLTPILKLIAEARAEFKKDLKKLAKSGNLSTFAYTNHRVADGSDYSEFKLLFERHVNPLEVILNGGFSIYNKPDPAKNQEKLRDFLFSGSLEWASNSNPLFRGDPELATPITVALSGRYQRLMENENLQTRQPDIGSFQARLEIPVAPGFSIPIAYTYSSATEMMAKPENRFNVGLHLDVNKILSFKKAASAQ